MRLFTSFIRCNNNECLHDAVASGDIRFVAGYAEWDDQLPLWVTWSEVDLHNSLTKRILDSAMSTTVPSYLGRPQWRDILKKTRRSVPTVPFFFKS